MDIRTLVDSASAPALAINADGRVLAANETFAAFTGRTESGFIGRRCSEVVNAIGTDGKAVCSHHDCPTLHSLAAGTPVHVDWSGCLGATGRFLPVRATTISIPVGERQDDAAALILMHPGHHDAISLTVPDVDAVQIRIRLMGRPEVWAGGEPRLIRRKRVIELIALLALSDADGMPRDRIVSALWPDAPRGNGRQHLRVLLHALRAALGADAIESTSAPCSTEEFLRLSPSVWVDVHAVQTEIEALHTECPKRSDRTEAIGPWLAAVEEVISLYRGDLDEAGVCGDWIVPHREQLRSRFLGLLAAAVPLAGAAGDVERVVHHCKRALAADPLDERFQIALLNAHGFLGQRALAVNQFREYRRILAHELALEPSFTVERALREAVGALDDRLT